MNSVLSSINPFSRFCRNLTGKRTLYFLENRDLFQKFAHKIIHVVLEERIETDNAWDRDHFQRNQILRGLTQCQDDDLILISDLDEIPSAAYFSYFLQPLIADQIPMVSLVQRMYQFYLNRDVGDWSVLQLPNTAF